MNKRVLFVILVAVVGIFVSTTRAKPRDECWIKGTIFLKPNYTIPGTYDPYETYIWTPRCSYRASDKIPLYVETFLSPARVHHDVESVLEIFRDPVFEGLYTWPTCGVRPAFSKVKIQKAPFKKIVRVVMKELEDVKLLPKTEYFPDPKTIPTHWLHGNPVKYEALDYISIMRLYHVEVRLAPGESFVRRIPNLLDFWRIRRGKDGKIYIYCAIRADTPTGWKGIWLPIEGRYDCLLYTSPSPRD